MNKLPEAMLELLGANADAKRAQDCLFAVVNALENAGIKDRAIGRALGQVTLGFCTDLGRKPENFGWATDVLDTVGDALKKRADASRRRWVRRFMRETGQLYRDASLCIDLEIPAVKEALDGRLQSLDTQGQA